MSTKNLPEPICHRCLGPIYNDPLLDNASVDLCSECFKFKAEEMGTESNPGKTREILQCNTTPEFVPDCGIGDEPIIRRKS